MSKARDQPARSVPPLTLTPTHPIVIGHPRGAA